MKRRLTTMIAGLLCFALLAGCGGTSEKTSDSSDAVKEENAAGESESVEGLIETARMALNNRDYTEAVETLEPIMESQSGEIEEDLLIKAYEYLAYAYAGRGMYGDGKSTETEAGFEAPENREADLSVALEQIQKIREIAKDESAQAIMRDAIANAIEGAVDEAAQTDYNVWGREQTIRTYDENGNLKYWIYVEYANPFECLRHTSYDAQGNETASYEDVYDEDGHHISGSESWNSDGVLIYGEWEYDTEGRVAKKMSKYPDGEINVSEFEYGSDANGSWTVERRYEGQGDLKYTITMGYDNDHKQTFFEQEFPDGLVDRTEYEYDDQGRLCRTTAQNGNYRVFEYHEDGSHDVISYDASGNELGRDTYQ